MLTSLKANQLDAVEDYSKRMGVSVAVCVSEAVDDWLLNVASARLEAVSQTEKPGTVIPFRAR